MTRTVDRLAEDAELARAELDRSIDQLTGRVADRLTPTGLIDEALSLARRAGYGAVLDDAIGTVRRHPVPALVATAAIGWLAMQWQNDRSRRAALARRHRQDTQPAAAGTGCVQAESKSHLNSRSNRNSRRIP